MTNMTQKSEVIMSMSATGETHARTKINIRDVSSVIDEPEARGGTNQGLTPTETLMASLIGCTNVISKRIAHKMGIELGEMDIQLSAKFDRRGTMLEEEIDVPFSEVTMDIEIDTDATEEQINMLKIDLAKFCPIAKVLRGSGVNIIENWIINPL
jgi:uncharacterized OsmC-like protein|tara:strand:+ start:558 stop:1022 length:465 start_codon:yes stop_codon:yes gene_type:complete